MDDDRLVARARALVPARGRAVLGLTGPPGAGKTTLVEELLTRLRDDPPPGADEAWVAHLPMDGFHLADVQLDRLGLRDRKGAPQTFDAAGYAATLERVLAAGPDDTVYAPGFERDLEQPLAAAVAVLPAARLVLTEGNYLLLDDPVWRRVRAAMAEVWYVDLADDVRRERLVARHVRFGKTPEHATAWAERSDEANAELVRATRDAADLVVRR